MSLALRNISNDKLISAYSRALELDLDEEFINYLEVEVRRRNLSEILVERRENNVSLETIEPS